MPAARRTVCCARTTLALVGRHCWRRIGAVNGVALTNSGVIVAQVDNGLLHSSDDGASWSELVADNVDCVGLDAHGATLLMAMADGRIRQSSL